jgi:hypothetical protein
MLFCGTLRSSGGFQSCSEKFIHLVLLITAGLGIYIYVNTAAGSPALNLLREGPHSYPTDASGSDQQHDCGQHATMDGVEADRLRTDVR